MVEIEASEQGAKLRVTFAEGYATLLTSDA